MVVRDFFNLKAVKEEDAVGIEIEMEGRSLPTEHTEYWRVTGDGSLRGNGYEYVLQQPIPFKKVGPALKALQKSFKEWESLLSPSDRCGVHVHVNVQEMTMRQLMNFIILYASLENILVHYCGPSREGNLFCLRMCDAEHLADSLIDCVEHADIRYVVNDQYRYAALNVSALGRYGSLEFRSLQTPTDILEIETWAEMLLQVKKKSLEFQNPWEIVEYFSRNGEELFLDAIFEHNSKLLKVKGYEERLWECTRLVQNIAYQEQEISWEDKEKEYPAKKKKNNRPQYGNVEIQEENPEWIENLIRPAAWRNPRADRPGRGPDPGHRVEWGDAEPQEFEVQNPEEMDL